MPEALEKLLQSANEAQKEAITHDNGPLLIIAGAGTGKTTVLTRRLAYLVETGKAKTEEILALTFTDKAAGEMEERVDKLLPYGFVDLWVMTFHAFGERILRDNALSIGLPNSFRVLSETDQWMLIRRNLERFKLDYYKPLGNPTRFIHALLRHMSRAKDEVITPEQYLEYAQSLKLDKDLPGDADERMRTAEVAEAYHVYTRLLRENDALDFGDLINETVRLFRTRPQILEKYRRQFKYIVVDEFQDTNIAQFELLRLLAGDKANITVVGDDDQSIYKFRGASVSNILQFKQYYPTAKQVILTENYRTPQLILDAAYNFIQANNPNRLEFQLRAQGASASGGDAGLSKKLLSHAPHDGFIKRIHAQTLNGEARAVANEILEMIKKDPDTDLSQFAILSRSNDGASPFISALASAEIPFIFYASRGLYQKPIILDILSYLKLLDNYHESPAVYRVLSSPAFALRHADMVKLTHGAERKAWPLYEACKQSAIFELSEEGVKKVKEFLSLVERHTELARSADVRRVILAFLEDTGYMKKIVGEETQTGRERLSYINQFWRVVEEFAAAEAEPTSRLFIERVNMQIEAGEEGKLAFDPDIGPEAVRVMTVHAAKGLEFDYVFLVSLIDRRFPSTERADAIELPSPLVKEILSTGDEHLEEERRLFYVGMTRTKKGLYLTSAEDYGGSRKRKLSRFLTELGYKDEVPIPDFAVKGGIFVPDGKEKESDAALKEFAPEAFSFSQLSLYETCPRQYKFKHVLKIPTKGEGKFSFGRTMHAALQGLFTAVIERQSSAQGSLFDGKGKARTVGELVDEKELDAIYEESWIDEWYESAETKENYRKEGKKQLRDYYRKVKDSVVRPLFLEKPFNVKIGGATVRGAIDRVDLLADGTVSIIDYKTGEPRDEESIKFENKRQLLIYQIAALESLGKKPSELSFHYLKDASDVGFLGTEPELEKIRTFVEKTAGKIREGQFGPEPNARNCRSCPFRGICESREL